MGERNQYNKILVTRFSSLGDVILTTPLLRKLRNLYPAAEIHYLTKQTYSEVIKNNPNIDRLIEVEDGFDFSKLRKLRKGLSAESYDLIIDLHNNLRTYYLKLFLRWSAKVLTFKKYSFRKFLLVKFKINLMKDLPPVIKRYINTINSVGTGRDLSNNPLTPEIFISTENAQSLHSKISRLSTPDSQLICIIPSSNHFTKTYPAEYYIQLIKMFDETKYNFILAGKGKDKKNIEKIKNETGSNVYDFCDKLNLLELTELMKRCSLVITGDTGPMHLAESTNTPIIMLAGSSVKEFGFYPQSEKAIIIENEGLKCRPCSHIGRSECPLGHFKCMMELRPELIYGAALNI